LWPKNYRLEVGAEQQKILRHWIKYAFLRIVHSLSVFSLGYIKTPWGDVPKFGTMFSAFIVDKTSGFCLSIDDVEPFGSYTLPIDGRSEDVRRNLRFPRQIF